MTYTLIENWNKIKDHQGDQHLVYRYLEKYMKASNPRNLIDQANAITDILYVTGRRMWFSMMPGYQIPDAYPTKSTTILNERMETSK